MLWRLFQEISRRAGIVARRPADRSRHLSRAAWIRPRANPPVLGQIHHRRGKSAGPSSPHGVASDHCIQ